MKLSPRQPHLTRYENWFVASVGVLLLVTACIKFVSAFQPASYAKSHNAVIGLFSNQQIYVITGFFEMFVVLGLLFLKSNLLRISMILWAGCCFALYHVAESQLDPVGTRCPCLGNMDQWLNVSPQSMNSGVLGMIAYCLCISALFLVLKLIKWPRDFVNE